MTVAAIYSPALIKGLKMGLKPDPIMKVSEWADEFRILPNTVAEPGKFRTSRTPYLREIMDKLSVTDVAQKVVFQKCSQIGAALELSTPLPTPTGWTTMGNVKVGDQLFDEQGNICNVTFVTGVMENHKCFKLTFSDGSTVIADEDHRWLVSKDRAVKKKIYTTGEMFPVYKKKNRNIFAIENVKPLNTVTIPLTVPPYTLGVWLGDGNSRSNRISTHEDDAFEMAEHIKSEGIDIQITNQYSKGKCTEIILDPVNKKNCKRGHVLSEGWKINGRCRKCHNQRSNGKRYVDPIKKESVFKEIIKLGISPVKRIPAAYLRADITQRMSLIQGMMDTDGTVNKQGGHCEFYTIYPDLADDFFELIASVGLKPVKIKKNNLEKKSINDHDCKTCGFIWIIRFKAYKENAVVRLQRKATNLISMVNGRPSETFNRRIVCIEPVATVPVKCISVDSASHLYLCGKSMIPTHNTESGNNWLGYVIDIAPNVMIYVMPTDTMMKNTSTTRIQPMINNTPALTKKINPARSKDGGNTMLKKEFSGGFVLMVGANSPVGLSSTAARFLYLDEVDRYPMDVAGEGDAIALAETRTSTFGARRKIFITSTPTLEGASIIQNEFKETGQRYYNVPCPCCGTMMPLKFEQLRWEENKYNDVYYECQHCQGHIKESSKTVMLANGEWIALFPEMEDGITFGYHLNALYSPSGWYSWTQMAREFDKAKDNLPKKITFINTKLGETYKTEGDSPEWETVYNKREQYKLNTPNKNVIFLTAGVDIQKDRIELEIVGWGKGKQSWSVDFRVLVGSTDSPESPVWAQLKEVLNETWIREDGAELPLQFMAVDSGFNTSIVYDFARNNVGKVIPIKGQDSSIQMVSPPRAVDTTKAGKKVGVKVWNVGSSLIKTEIYGHLKLQQNEDGSYPNGYCHFPEYDRVYFRGLTAEKIKRSINKKGYTVYTWEKHYERNEPLDCRAYARAAANVVGMDRWSEATWEKHYTDTLDLIKIEKAETPSKPKVKKGSGFWNGR